MLRAIHHRPLYKKFYALMAIEFVFSVTYGILSFVLPLRGEEIFKNIALLGVIFALPEALGVLIDIPVGAIANRFGRRRAIFYSAVLLILSSAFFIETKNPFVFIGILLLYEVATQLYLVPSNAELMAISPLRKVGFFNGLAEGMHNLGFSVGPVVAGILLVYQLGYSFYLAAAFGIIMALLSIIFLAWEHNRENFIEASANVIRRDKFFAASIREFRGLGFTGWFLVFLFFVFAVHWGFFALMEPLYTDALGLSGAMMGLIYAGLTIPILIVSLFAGKYIDRGAVRLILICGLLLMSASTVGFGLTKDPATLFTFALVGGVGDALLLPAIFSTIDRLSSYRAKEHISGVEMFAESAGYLVGPLTGGLAAALFGFANTFLGLGLGIALLAFATLGLPLNTASAIRITIPATL